MPSSGYGAVCIVGVEGAEGEKRRRLIERAEHAMQHGLFIEWLEAFLAAWEQTRDVDIASYAGIVEWDL